MRSQPPDNERLARARQGRQVISGADLRPPPAGSGVYTADDGLFSPPQRTYLIALLVLLAIAVVLYVIFSFAVASIFFFLLALGLGAGWFIF